MGILCLVIFIARRWLIFNVLIRCCVGEPMLMHRPCLDKYILVIKPLASFRNYKKQSMNSADVLPA